MLRAISVLVYEVRRVPRRLAESLVGEKVFPPIYVNSVITVESKHPAVAACRREREVTCRCHADLSANNLPCGDTIWTGGGLSYTVDHYVPIHRDTHRFKMLPKIFHA